MGDFEPAKYLTKVQGRDYLEVKWRIVWIRDHRPEASIQTELVRADENGVTFRAEVAWPNDDGVSPRWITRVTGYAYEPWDAPKRYGGAIENAETSAIGRALGAAGYGTQFSTDHEFGADGGRVVDSPAAPAVARHSAPRPAPPAGQDVRPHEPAVPAMYKPSPDEPATDQQRKRIFAKSKGLEKWMANWSDAALRTQMSLMTGKESSTELTVAEADELIDYLAKMERNQPSMMPAS